MHKHHIIPKSRGGTDDEWNLEEISPYHHAYEHALDFVLFDKAPTFDCRHEGWPLLPEDLKEAVKLELRKRINGRRKAMNEARKGKPSGNAESRALHSFRMTGKGNSFFGKTHTAEVKAKISATRRGQKTPSPQVVCPHCGKIGASRAMGRWHFDNCKHNTN